MRHSKWGSKARFVQNEHWSPHFGQFQGQGRKGKPELAKTSTYALDLANFEVVGHRKAQIDQNENLHARFDWFEVVVGWLGQRKAKTSTQVLILVRGGGGWLGTKLANFEVVGHRKAQIDQTGNLCARFGRFEVVVGWLGQRKAKIDQNEHLHSRLGQFQGRGFVRAQICQNKHLHARFGQIWGGGGLVRPKESPNRPKRAIARSIWSILRWLGQRKTQNLNEHLHVRFGQNKRKLKWG